MNRRFPQTRLRRLRHKDWMLALVQETQLGTNDLILPLFIHDADHNEPIASMPAVMRHSLPSLLATVEQAIELGIKAIALFPVTNHELKTDDGREAWNADNLVCSTIREIKQRFPEIGIIADVALDPYTTHGHDGLIINDYVDNDATLEALIKQSAVQVEAGCDIIAPSDMMDGRIGAIRDYLESAQQPNIHIMSYAAKFNSSFYGPFREAVAAGSDKPVLDGGKSSYQLNSANAKEAMQEIALDIAEGADSIIVKPAMPYLDIVRQASDQFQVPVFAYQVSGEYSMLQSAASTGALALESIMMESLLAFKRSGASGIWTYFAIQAAKIIRQS